MVAQGTNCNHRRQCFWEMLLAWCVGLAIMAVATKYLVNSGMLVNNPWGIFGVCIGWWALGVTCMLVDNYRRNICCGTNSESVRDNKSFWNTILDFKGRATRRQFWCGLICYGILIWAIMTLIMLWLQNGLLALIACLVFLIPLWALFARRLHDAGATGLWTIFPCVGALACVFSWFVTIFWGVSWYFANVGLDVWGILVYLLSAVFIGLIPSKGRK